MNLAPARPTSSKGRAARAERQGWSETSLALAAPKPPVTRGAAVGASESFRCPVCGSKNGNPRCIECSGGDA